MYPQGYPNWDPSVYELVPNIGEFHGIPRRMRRSGWQGLGDFGTLYIDQVRQFKEGHR